MASHSFTQQDNVGKAIIVITDGEDHEGGAMEAAKEAHDQGYNIYIMGIGSTKGEPVPDPSTGNYMTDNQGNMVMSKLNEDMCREIAQAGGGAYIHVDNSSSAQRLLDEELDKLEKGETVIYSNYEELFQYAGLLTMLLLIIEICIMYRKNPILKKIKLFKK
jgi:Ca-activated chloride channel family protein